MINIRDITALIRSAIYGKDVRENIALGLEQISDKEDAFEQTVTSRQNTYEQSITNRQSSYESSLTTKENAFEQSFNNAETTRQNQEATRQNNESGRVTVETARVAAEASRVTAETSRVTAETTRQSQEASRQLSEQVRVLEWTDWKTANTMLNDLLVRKAVMIPVRTTLTVSRAGLAINPLNSYNPTSITAVTNDTVVDNGVTKDTLCYFAKNQVRGLDSITFKTMNEHILNGAEVV